MELLALIAGKDGIKVDRSKVEVIQQRPKPESHPKPRRVLGLVQAFKRFIKGFSELARPLTDLTQKRTWNWCLVVERRMYVCVSAAEDCIGECPSTCGTKLGTTFSGTYRCFTIRNTGYHRATGRGRSHTCYCVCVEEAQASGRELYCKRQKVAGFGSWPPNVFTINLKDQPYR